MNRDISPYCGETVFTSFFHSIASTDKLIPKYKYCTSLTHILVKSSPVPYLSYHHLIVGAKRRDQETVDLLRVTVKEGGHIQT